MAPVPFPDAVVAPFVVHIPSLFAGGPRPFLQQFAMFFFFAPSKLCTAAPAPAQRFKKFF